ncbi:MAG: type 1 glutamine amidotransferase [Ignavibacteriaceae bacterium]
MKIHYLQHKPFESLGCIEDWINKRGYPVSATKFYENTALPDLSEFDFLIVMGGPMGVYDEEKYPWLRDEKLFIRKAIENNKIILGICLGSQLIAASMGVKVHRNKFKEIGWFPIQININNNIFSGLPKEIISAHWHGDTFDLPHEAIHAAESSACRNQAFILNEKVIGLQFHLEFTSDSLKELIKNGREELVKDQYVQTEEEILKNLALLDTTNNFLFQILNNIVKINYD